MAAHPAQDLIGWSEDVDSMCAFYPYCLASAACLEAARVNTTNRLDFLHTKPLHFSWISIILIGACESRVYLEVVAAHDKRCWTAAGAQQQ